MSLWLAGDRCAVPYGACVLGSSMLNSLSSKGRERTGLIRTQASQTLRARRGSRGGCWGVAVTAGCGGAGGSGGVLRACGGAAGAGRL